MYLQFHILSGFPIHSMNCDSNGRPKTVEIGGSLRGRISSQSLKRNIRLAFPENAKATRSKMVISNIYKDIIEESEFILTEEQRKTFFEAILTSIHVTATVTKDKNAQIKKVEKIMKDYLALPIEEQFDFEFNKLKETTLIFLTDEEIDLIKSYYQRFFLTFEQEFIFNSLISSCKESKKSDSLKDLLELTVDLNEDYSEVAAAILEQDLDVTTLIKAIKSEFKILTPEGKKLDKTLPSLLVIRKEVLETNLGTSMDVGLFGRMFASEGLQTEAATFVSHSFTTHSIYIEDDYFIAADDLDTGNTGASHLDTKEFSSGVYYSYIGLNLQTLSDNMKKEDLDNEIEAFVKSLISNVSGSGKEHGIFGKTLPDFILIERGDSSPRNFGQAFIEPVKKNFLEDSKSRLLEYKESTDFFFGEDKPSSLIFNISERKTTLVDIINFSQGK